jgi:hypothetical protein
MIPSRGTVVKRLAEISAASDSRPGLSAAARVAPYPYYTSLDTRDDNQVRDEKRDANRRSAL